MTDVIYIANTNALRLVGLKNKIEDDFINDATVTVTVKTREGVDVDGVTWPVPAEYVPGSDGDYLAILPHTMELTNKGKYVAHVDAVGNSPDNVGNWQRPVQAFVRTGP